MIQTDNMKIVLRTETGWSEPVENGLKKHCDICEKPLFEAPHGVIYCDSVHEKDVIEHGK